MRRQFRFLWGKIFVASHCYSCDYCICPIEPGDEYEREVYGNCCRLMVKLKHHPICFGPNEEEDKKIREDLEQGSENQQGEEKFA